VDGKRERLTDLIWDGYLPRIHNLSAEDLRALRERARGRAIAVVGMDAWWAYYGRDFTGNPVYVPAGIDARRPRLWSFVRDDRAHADSTTWRRNLEASGARFVVVGAFGGDCERVPAERRWMAARPDGFRRVAGSCCAGEPAPAARDASTGCDEAWRVLAGGGPAERMNAEADGPRR
jgi:hypothetical protein